MKPRVLLAAVSAFAGAGVLALTATAPPARALDPSAVQTVVVGGPATALLPLQVDQLYPGSGTHARFVVRRGSTWSGGAFAVTVTDVEDLERGCNRPEQNAGDTTCGAGSDQGELSDQLLLNAAWSADASACATAPVPAALGSMRVSRDVAFPAALPPAVDEACLVLALQLPISADNLVQSDLVRFSLRIGLDGAALAGLPGGPLSVRTPDASPTTPSPTPEGTPSPGPPDASAPDASASPIAGIDEQPAQVTPTGPSGTGTPTAAPAPADSGAPAAALAPQSRALPFTGGQPVLLLGWGALLVFAGHVLVRAARQRGRLT